MKKIWGLSGAMILCAILLGFSGGGCQEDECEAADEKCQGDKVMYCYMVDGYLQWTVEENCEENGQHCVEDEEVDGWASCED